MTLPVDFHFSQASLQDYVECQRRFQLRYLVKLAWPAVEAEPVLENEKQIQIGGQFHRLIHQYLVGIDARHLSSLAQGTDLQVWWQNYLRYAESIPGGQGLIGSGGNCQVESSLTASINNFRLIAKFDAVVLIGADNNAKVVIYDWKTSSKRPPRAWLAKRLQTRIYPYLMVRAGVSFNKGFPFIPEQIEMIFWFSNFPEDPERFNYDSSQYEQDDQYLKLLIQEIDSLSPDAFFLTNHEKICRFCTYRSLCDRGIDAGSVDEVEFKVPGDEEPQQAMPILDFEQVAEIEF